MSLSSALNVAQSSLSATSLQSSIISRNVAGQGDVNFNRKAGLLVTGYGGTVRIASVGRAMDMALFYNKLQSNAATSAQRAMTEGLNRLEATVNDPELNQSLSAKLGDLTNALQQYGVTPDDPILAQNVLSRATTMAATLNDASETVRAVRQQADTDMSASVDRINDLLSQFEVANSTIVKGSQSGADITDALDTRDRLLSELSSEIGISTTLRSGNDMVIYTDSGVTLFETVARSVRMAPTSALGPADTGNPVFVDGVQVTGQGAVMPIKSGALHGNALLRDEVSVTYQRQLDEIARGLIEVFAESDQNPVPVKPDAAGLFTYAGGPGIPPTGTVIPGLASQIRINPNADPAQGGDLDRIRDGGLSDPLDLDFNYNPAALAGFSGRIQEMLDQLGAQRTFDPVSQADPTNSLAGFASSSVSWLEGMRQTANRTLDYQETLLTRTSEALSNKTGVNIDEEMTLLLELERSYSASSTLITTIDRMLAALLDAVR